MEVSGAMRSAALNQDGVSAGRGRSARSAGRSTLPQAAKFGAPDLGRGAAASAESHPWLPSLRRRLRCRAADGILPRLGRRRSRPRIGTSSAGPEAPASFDASAASTRSIAGAPVPDDARGRVAARAAWLVRSRGRRAQTPAEAFRRRAQQLAIAGSLCSSQVVDEPS